jgi:hypothetical protein
MRIVLILVYTMLSVELSIGWLKIRCARMRAHIVSLIGAWVHLSTHPRRNGVCSLNFCVFGMDLLLKLGSGSRY